MNMTGVLAVFYNSKKNEMDKSKFKNNYSKFYNFLLEKIIKDYKVNFNDLMLENIELFKYENECIYKPAPYDVSGAIKETKIQIITDKIGVMMNKYKKYKNLITNLDLSKCKLEDYILENPNGITFTGIQEKINDLDIKIQEKQLTSNYDQLQNNKTIDEFIEKKLSVQNIDGTTIKNDINYLSKTQKELEIYQNIIYILYFLLSSSLGFFYLFKNK